MYGQIRENVGRCLNCPVNTYQPESGQFGCILCPGDYITATEGAKDVSECYPGNSGVEFTFARFYLFITLYLLFHVFIYFYTTHDTKANI